MFPSERRRVAVVATLTLVAAVGAACGSSDPPPNPGFAYAALGDSFTSGPGLHRIIDDGCQRSDHNYPHLVAQRLEAVDLTDVSCGGARTDAVLQSQVQSAEGRVQPPQIEAVTADTDLVTVGLGANDALNELQFVAAAALACIALAEVDRDGTPCEDANARKIPRIVDKAGEGLASALAAIANRAPDARIIVVGYPRLFEGPDGCPRVFPVAEGDIPYIQDSYDRLNAALETAAREAGADFVDVAAASKGHDVCSDSPWVNGRRVDKATGAAAYHPMPAMQKSVAKLILDLL